MNIPTRIAARLPLLASPSLPSSSSSALPLHSFSSVFSHHRLRNLGNLEPTVNTSRLKRCVAKKMAWSLEKSNGGVETHLGVVWPATEAHAEEAVGALRAGKVIAVPTDTLYGIACDACSLEAVNRIYEIKGRKHTSPLAICVGDVSDIERFAVTDHLPHGLLEVLLPGPVTLVLSRGESSILEKSLNPGLHSIGVRVPDCNFIRDIARGLGSALALTSANLSGQPSSVSIKDFENLWEHCAYVYNGGVLPSGRAGSTVVDLTRIDKYKILRPGSARDETVAILERFSLEEEGTAT
ncbi:threonylcarbamoyl-AMP synthase isoform X1 [Pyrus x bretschneideri]|uniref:threonylcarbamoyl-AMP synthase isoform X1 n=2 Tax=Pyrus x bretschneideri TaxID=225117 RepID=UPI00202E1B90|nr:threonylcarbamoyl-AMP synthase isoform X1 [Pyrus x bretschneideri]